MILGCVSVEPTQNSAVTFFWYSFSDSPERFGLTSFTAYTCPPFFPLMRRTVPPAPLPRTLPHFPYFLERWALVASLREWIAAGYSDAVGDVLSLLGLTVRALGVIG